MATVSPRPDDNETRKELHLLNEYWPWFLTMGIAMVALGSFAIGWACLVTLTVAATWLFGFVLLASGVAVIINSFWSGKWSGMLLHLLMGILYVVVGVIIIDQPLESALNLTLLIALFLMVSGIFRMVFAIIERFSGWGWVLLNGGVSLMLGLIIYKEWPASGLMVIGLFIGIDLIFNGWAWIMLSLAARNAPKVEAAA